MVFTYLCSVELVYGFCCGHVRVGYYGVHFSGYDWVFSYVKSFYLAAWSQWCEYIVELEFQGRWFFEEHFYLDRI
ncbi:MAG: hypothetical protein KBONHNOK_01647 [Candidatus Methanoperedenaceae archaeon GB50]|nr:MAG: hypothetical protein KBONHNOK_01647 [Candidatus Methanoperedenaceae archaeon GB50]